LTLTETPSALAIPAGAVPVMRILHTIHAIRDLPAARERYYFLFGAIAFAEGYHAGEDRDMTLLYVTDHIVELMSPRTLEATDKTFARYLQRYGESFHSIELRVPDIQAAHRACEAAGVQLSTNYGDFFFIHPKAAGGVIIEVYGAGMPNDPQDRAVWNPDWNKGHASGLRRLDHIAFVTRDPGAVLRLLTEVFDGKIVDDHETRFPQPCRRVMIELGDARIGVISPTTDEPGPFTDYFAGSASGLYAMVWQVDDPARSKAYFEGAGAPIIAGVTNPEAFGLGLDFMFGARHEFVASSSV
jgi:4-hydroxyphenylpyruvate dioxygenase-like putative hemolysin